MITAHDDRHPFRQRGGDRLAQRIRPGDGFRQMVNGGIGAGLVSRSVGNDIAAIFDRVAKCGQRARQSGGAIGCGAHQAAGAPLALVHGGADEDAMRHLGLLMPGAGFRPARP